MERIEKRIVLDDSTERIFQYTAEPPVGRALWPGLLAAREVHRLIDSALTAQLRNLDQVMTWRFQPDRLSAPRPALDGDHIYWSPC